MHCCGVSSQNITPFFSTLSLPDSPDEDFIARLWLYMSKLQAVSTRQPRILSHTPFISKSSPDSSLQCDSVKKPLQQPYFKVVTCSKKYYVFDINGSKDTVNIDCFKPAFLNYTSNTSSLVSPLSTITPSTSSHTGSHSMSTMPSVRHTH